MLKIRQLMRRSEPVLDLHVWQVLKWVGDEIEDCPERLLWQGIDDHVKHLLVINLPQSEGQTTRLSSPARREEGGESHGE
jgi:hypothetical protein